MHERQATVVLSLLLVLSIIFANDSFGEKYQRDSQGDNDEDKNVKKGGDDSDKFKKWKSGNEKHEDGHDKNYSIDDLQKQIMDLQNQIKNIMLGIIYWSDIQEIPEDIANGDNDTLSELSCGDGEIPKKHGEEWECSVDLNDSAETNEASSAIFFHFGLLANGQIEWVGTSTQTYDPVKIDEASIVMPTSGTLSNLFARTGTSLAISPGVGLSYKITLLVNGVETTPTLSCIIADDSSSCSDKINKIFVNEGDALVLKIEASKNAPFAYISSSVILT